MDPFTAVNCNHGYNHFQRNLLSPSSDYQIQRRSQGSVNVQLDCLLTAPAFMHLGNVCLLETPSFSSIKVLAILHIGVRHLAKCMSQNRCSLDTEMESESLFFTNKSHSCITSYSFWLYTNILTLTHKEQVKLKHKSINFQNLH